MFPNEYICIGFKLDSFGNTKGNWDLFFGPEPGGAGIFIPAKLLPATAALETTVRSEPEPLRMAAEPHLPAQEDRHAGPKQGLGIPVGDPHEGGGHHPGAPGKDPAVDTAPVLHQKGLERAEEQHTHQVTEIGQGAQQDQGGGGQEAPVV